jgi:hypothetical protein
MTTPERDDWAGWRDAWGGAPSGLADSEVTAARSRADAERRRARLASVLVSALAAASVAGIAVAVRHAPERATVAWGAVVAAAILAFAAVERARHGSDAALALPTESYVAHARARGRAQLRAARAAWVVVGLTLAFLAPWWVEGFRAHGAQLGSAVAIAGWWVPAAAIVVVVAWTVRVHRRVAAELSRLDAFRADD